MKFILAIILFLFLITFHEFGHFLAAKLSGIRVNEFSVGMGPLIFSKESGETSYSFRLIPIGGYCAMEGEDDESSDPRSYDRAPAYKRFLTILAGPVSNLILAVLVFIIVGLMSGVVTTTIGDFTENSPAKAAGFEIGDKITEIGSADKKIKINDFADISKAVADFYKDRPYDESISIVADRDGQEVTYINEVKPEIVDGKLLIGIMPARRTPGLLEAIGLGFTETGKNIKMIFTVLARLFTGKLPLGALSGPIGVLKEIGNQANNGFANLLYFLGYISVNLAVFNLLPIPALDGSKLIASVVEMVTGKRINKKFEERITLVGFFILIGLIVVVSVKDIINLF